MQVHSSSCLIYLLGLTAVFALVPPRRPHILGGLLLVPPACRGTFSGGAVFYQDVCTLSGLNNRPHLCRQAVHAFGRLQQRLLHSLSQAMELQAAGLESTTPRLPTKEDVVHPHKKHLVRICLSCLLYVTHSVIQLHLSRDGRALRGQAKPKDVDGIQRFLSRGSGYVAKTPEATLQQLGLEDLAPCCYGRTA